MTNESGYSSFIPSARELHQRMIAVDTHCDTPDRLMLKGWDLGVRHEGGTLLGGDLDLIRMKEGGLAAVFFAIFVPQGPCTPEGYETARKRADELLDAMDTTFRKHPDLCERALSPADVRRIHATGRRALFLGMENGYPLGRDVDSLDTYYQRGVRYLTLCHASDNDLCAACTDWCDGTMVSRRTEDTGLTDLGAHVVKRMNQLGMMVDLSHTSERTVTDVLRLTDVPLIASHSGARSISDHPRNLSDAQIQAIASQGGVVQVLFVPSFLNTSRLDPQGDQAFGDLWTRMKAHYSVHAMGTDPAMDAAFESDFRDLLARFPAPPATVRDVADHIDHVVKVAGIDHVGVGSDFDGGGHLEDCRDISELPHLTAELLRRGYSEADLQKLWSENLFRVFEEVIERAKGA